MDVRQQLKFINLMSGLFVAYFSYLLLSLPEMYKRHVVGIIFFILTSLLSFAILKKRPSPFHTWKSLIIRIVMEVVVILGRWKYKKYFENPSKKDLQEVQKETLFTVLQEYKNTKYGKDMKIGEIKTVEEYRSKIPLNTFWTMEKYMAMSYRGEKDVTISGPVEYLAKSSGTTGRNKAYPFNSQLLKRFTDIMFAMIYILRKNFPKYTLTRSIMIRVFSPKRYNEYGICVGPVSQSRDDLSIYELMTVPYDALIEVFDEEVILYINAVFSLRELYVDNIDCFFPSLILSFVKCMEKHWESICDDVENGKISEHLEISPELRAKLNSKLTKQPERAEFLRCEFRKGMKNIIKRIWPEMNYITLVNSGSFKSSFDYVKSEYLEDLDTFSPVLGGTEGLVGMNLDGSNIDPSLYTVSPLYAFFEFIPVENVDDEQPETVLLHEIELGRTYEVVVTNLNGLYRHRIGDCVKFVKHFGSLPVCEMSYRLAHCLNVKNERLDENNFQNAIREAFAKMNDKKLIEYTATEYLYFAQVAGENTINDRYVLFVELMYSKKSKKAQLTKAEIKSIDDELMKVHQNYGLYRTDKRIKPMVVYELKPGTFAGLKKKIVEENPDTSSQQYKLARVITNLKLLGFLKENILK